MSLCSLFINKPVCVCVECILTATLKERKNLSDVPIREEIKKNHFTK